MDIALWITTLPPWLLFILTVVAGVLAAELGVRLQKKSQKVKKEGETSGGTLVGAMLGLLAFMLGFTFSITASRFADRKALVVHQSNAIGTCYLRTSFLPENQKIETRKLLREYVDILVQTKDYAALEKGIVRMERIHLLIWNQTASLAKEDMDSELRSLFVSSVNEVIDIFSERKTVALVFRIPSVLWLSLFFLFIVSMFIVGYEIDANSNRRILDTPMMAAAFALVVVLIANMDSTRGVQRFRVSQQPLIEVQQMMRDSIP